MADLRGSVLVLALAATLVGAEDPRALLLQGRALQIRGGGDDPKAAAALFRKVVGLVPDSSEAHLRLSEALQELEDLDGALPEAERALALAPQSAEAQAHLALLRYQRAQKTPAEAPAAARDLRAAALKLPQDPELWARLGEMCEASKDNEGAMRAWIRLGRLRPGYLPAWERAYIHARATQNYDAKREALLALATRGPDERNLRLLEELAREQIKLGYLAHAEESFLLLARYLPQEAGLWENIALIRIQTSRYAEALEMLARAEAAKPGASLSYHTARALMFLGRFKEAEARLAPLVAGPTDPPWIAEDAQIRYAQVLLLQGRTEPLLDHLRHRAPHPATDGEALAFKAQAFISLGDWKSALAAIREGRARHPKVALFHLAAGLTEDQLDYRLFSRGEAEVLLEQIHLELMASYWQDFQRWDRCLEALERARKLGPVRSVDLLVMQSQALDQLNRPAESLAVLREALAMEPANPLVQNNIGYLLLEQGQNLEEAVALIERSAKATPDNGSVVDSLGWAQFKLGRLQEAEATLRRAADLNPFSPEVRKHLGEVLVKVGKLAEAAEQWERALAFAFPDRKDLEKRLAELRARIAREQAARPQDPSSPQVDPDPDDDEDEP